MCPLVMNLCSCDIFVFITNINRFTVVYLTYALPSACLELLLYYQHIIYTCSELGDYYNIAKNSHTHTQNIYIYTYIHTYVHTYIHQDER